MTFGKCIHFCNHQPSHSIQRFPHPKELSLAPLLPVFSKTPLQITVLWNLRNVSNFISSNPLQMNIFLKFI